MSDNTASPVEVERELGTRPLPGGEGRAAIFRRTYDNSIEDVWEACTDPDRLKRWFLPVSGDLRAGGNYSVEGVAGGEILRCDAPHLLTLSWQAPDFPIDEVELRLTAAGPDRTVLELEHAMISGEVEFDGDLVDAITNAGGGWEPCLAGLDLFLRGQLTGDDFDMSSFRSRPEIAKMADRAKDAWGALVDSSA
jgi:uncharacterized protein YndB with AHSA1/START domain